jgi:lipopolysaccharide export system permease protein
MFARAETLANMFLTAGGGPLALTNGQLWLRQADRGLTPHGVAIVHANDVALHGKTLIATTVTVFRLNEADQLLSRIEATRARLAGTDWTLEQARAVRPDALPEPPRTIVLPTDLTVARVQESFASPDTLSVWELPGFIRLLNRSGFSSIRHRLHFQALLALPLLCSTMALVAAGFSMRPTRHGGVARMIGSGVASGFALFMISKLAEEFGQSGAIPVMLAAWVPAAAGMMLALALLLHMEDG